VNTKDSNYLGMKEKLVLPYNQNQLQFEFSAPTYMNEKQVLYSYRIMGSGDTSWSKASNNHIIYTNLQPGKYRFEVRTLGWNGSYSNTAFFEFVIKPPFWRTTWFYILCALALGAVLYGIYRYRIRQLVKLQQVRNRIATDLHDDIGSSLTNISLLAELGNKNITEPQQAKLFISRISEEAISSGQALDDIVWSINARNDSLEQVSARMRRYAAEVFDGADIGYSLQMEEQFATCKLDIEQRRELFLIFKEAINNIYKHAKATRVDINLYIRKGWLYLQVTDNGIGFDTTTITHRNGIKNMQHRIANRKGAFTIQSETGKGTSIQVSMPL
jgi:signal transduction histidine kinase